MVSPPPPSLYVCVFACVRQSKCFTGRFSAMLAAIELAIYTLTYIKGIQMKFELLLTYFLKEL